MDTIQQVERIFSAEAAEAFGRAAAKAARLLELKIKPALTPAEVEELYNLKASTLAQKRCRGGGPNYVQEEQNGPVLYRHADIEKYFAKNVRRSS